MAIPGQAVETQALPADHALDEPLGRHQRHLLGRHVFLNQRWTGVVRHHQVELACGNVCPRSRRDGENCGVCRAPGAVGCCVPEASGWTWRTDEAPPIVMSWAQSSVGFSNTSRTRKALNGLQRGCLVETNKQAGNPVTTVTS